MEADVYRKTKELLQKGQASEALELAKKLTSLHKGLESASAFLLVASCHEALSQFPSAISWYEKVLAAQPSHFEANFGLARCFRQTASAAKALDYFIRCMDLQPDNAEVLLRQGDLLRETKNSIEALLCYQKAAELDPTNAEAHLSVTQLLLSEGSCALASQYISRWYQKFDSKKLAKAASAFVAAGMLDISEGLLDYALRLDSSCAACHLVRGSVCFRRKQYPEAIEYYRRSIQLQETAESLSKLAEAQLYIGQVKEAEMSFARACELAPNDPTRVFNYVQCIEHSGDVSRASDYLMEYMKSTPRSQMTTLNHYALYLLEAKLLYVQGNLTALASLVPAMSTFPPAVMNALKGMKTIWSYFYFITRMLLLSPLEPPLSQSQPAEDLFVVGDSHCLVPAHRFIHLQGKRRRFVPKLVTGLKAYHLKENFSFVTVTNLHLLLAQIPRNTPLIILFCGELDCREGIPSALAKAVYKTEEEAVTKTVDIFANGLAKLSAKFFPKTRILIHSATPPVNPEAVQRSRLIRLWNKCLATQFPMHFIDLQKDLATKDGFLRLNFNCDGTHVGPQYLPVLEQQLEKLCSFHQ